MNNEETNGGNWIDRLAWNPERFAAMIDDVLDAIEFQLALEDWLADEPVDG